jgi:hypothetical protein
MSVLFFYPLAWLGVIAVGVPIWLHLQRRREANVILFSTLRFLEDQPVARHKPLWPRDLLLLLLRLLAVLLLVAAFAWPYLKSETEARVITESVVYILDNTLSHQVAGGTETSRAELADQLDAADRGRQVAVVELAATPRLIAGFGDAPGEAAARVRQLQPSFSRGDYRAAFRAASELLQQSLGQSRRIVLLADNQENQWQEGRESPPFLRDVQVDLPGVNETTRSNLAVWNPRAQRLLLGDSSLVQCQFDVYHQGPIESATLQVWANGSLLGERTLPLRDEPEISSVAFEWESDQSEWLQGEVRIQGTPDDLAGDNSVVFALPPIREGHVEVLTRSDFVRAALSPAVMSGRWQTTFATAESISVAPLTADVFCLESSFLESAAARQRVRDYLQRGRGVWLMLDEVTPAVAAFLRDLKLKAGKRVELEPADSKLRYYFQEHPTLAPFASGEFGNLLDINVFRYFTVDAPGGLPLIFAQPGDPVFFQVRGRGTLLVSAFALDRSDTSWPIHGSFVPWLDLTLTAARTAPPRLQSFLPGQADNWQVPADVEAREVVLRQENEEVGRATIEESRARLVLPSTPGLYALHYDDLPEPAAMLAVNPSPHESRLTYTDPEETLAGWKLKLPPATVTDPVEATGPISEAAILRQRLWWWLLLAGTTLLMCETGWLALRKGRR